MNAFAKVFSICGLVTGLHAQGPQIMEAVPTKPNQSKEVLRKEMKEIIDSFVEDY